VLLGMMLAAQADGPPVRGLEPLTAVGALAHVGAFDRKLLAAGDGAAVAPNPGAVRRTAAGSARATNAFNAAWQADARHGQHSH
jgi:hypothetical protein